jgi:glutaredoxin-like protein NrdH
VKEFLSREHLPFTARNVDEDDSAYDELIALGYRTVPLTIVGDRRITGFDADALRQAIAALRAPSDHRSPSDRTSS